MPKPICTIDGCGKPVLVLERGWCNAHYRRWKRHGDPLVTLRNPPGLHVVCTIVGCGKPAKRRGWCPAHYERWRKYGDTSITKFIVDDLARFNSNVIVTPDCWLWAGSNLNGGYACHFLKGRKTCAHRFSFTVFIGHIPPDLEIDHRCHNPGCVNPAHLQAVTTAFNLKHRGCGRSDRPCWHPLQFPGRGFSLAR